MQYSSTLTSLAMLKININEGKDYLEYLRPYILQVLATHKPEQVTDNLISEYVLTDFGLQIPTKTINILLQRISKSGFLARSHGIYQINGEIPNKGFLDIKSEAERKIKTVIFDLLNFEIDNTKRIETKEEAMEAICTFLSEFSVDCIKTYLRGTAISDIPEKSHKHIVLVSQYVIYLQKNDPDRFDDFLMIVQGHMLANALLCPDLDKAPKSYKGVAFYFDTPLLIQLLGLEGKQKRKAISELIDLLINLGGTVSVFSHTKQELENVVKGAGDFIENPKGRGAIIMEARRNGTTKADLILLANKIEEKLTNSKIEVISTPRYIEKFQISEEIFEMVLKDEVFYFNPRAKSYDINSVRSIYVLRKGNSQISLEKSGAVLVTSNAAFARAAYDYGMKHEESREVSTVISDFSLAIVAWLKAPMGAPSLPKTELMAYSYAAVKPSKEFLGKFLIEIEKMEQEGTITLSDHQLLRSSIHAQDELMNLTCGEEKEITKETITETLIRATQDIKKEEKEKLTQEQAQHEETKSKLKEKTEEKAVLQKHLYWKCKNKAKFIAWVISLCISICLLYGIVLGWQISDTNPLMGYKILFVAGLFSFVTFLNLLFGTTISKMHFQIENRMLIFFLGRVSNSTEINFGNMNSKKYN